MSSQIVVLGLEMLTTLNLLLAGKLTGLDANSTRTYSSPTPKSRKPLQEYIADGIEERLCQQQKEFGLSFDLQLLDFSLVH
jgi:hypothetical protein